MPLLTLVLFSLHTLCSSPATCSEPHAAAVAGQEERGKRQGGQEQGACGAQGGHQGCQGMRAKLGWTSEVLLSPKPVSYYSQRAPAPERADGSCPHWLPGA